MISKKIAHQLSIRNSNIFHDCLIGNSFSSAGKKYGLSGWRVSVIFRELLKKKSKEEKIPVCYKIYKLPSTDPYFYVGRIGRIQGFPEDVYDVWIG